MKICVLGSSHTVAFKDGWDLIQTQGAPDGVEVEFWAIGQNFLKCCAPAADGTYGPDPAFTDNDAHYASVVTQAKRINGRERIDLNEADVILLIGGRGTNIMVRFVSQLDVTGLFSAPNPITQVTQPTFFGITQDLLTNSLPKGDWTGLAHKTLLVVPEPHLSERFLDAEIGKAQGTRLKSLIETAPAAVDALLAYPDQLADALAAASPFGMTRQPDATVAQGVLTARTFSEGAKRLNDNVHENTDVSHANGEYGRLYWEQILTHLQAA